MQAMAELLILSFLGGVALGQRFRVLAIPPLTVAMGIIALPVGLIAQIAFLDGLKNVALCAVSLQAGYLFGAMARFWLAASRVLVRPLKIVR